MCKSILFEIRCIKKALVEIEFSRGECGPVKLSSHSLVNMLNTLHLIVKFSELIKEASPQVKVKMSQPGGTVMGTDTSGAATKTSASCGSGEALEKNILRSTNIKLQG